MASIDGNPVAMVSEQVESSTDSSMGDEDWTDEELETLTRAVAKLTYAMASWFDEERATEMIQDMRRIEANVASLIAEGKSAAAQTGSQEIDDPLVVDSSSIDLTSDSPDLLKSDRLKSTDDEEGLQVLEERPKMVGDDLIVEKEPSDLVALQVLGENQIAHQVFEVMHKRTVDKKDECSDESPKEIDEIIQLQSFPVGNTSTDQVLLLIRELGDVHVLANDGDKLLSFDPGGDVFLVDYKTELIVAKGELTDLFKSLLSFDLGIIATGVKIVVVATPHKMSYMLKKKALSRWRAICLVLDKTDRRFDLGFDPGGECSMVGSYSLLGKSPKFRADGHILGKDLTNSGVHQLIDKMPDLMGNGTELSAAYSKDIVLADSVASFNMEQATLSFDPRGAMKLVGNFLNSIEDDVQKEIDLSLLGALLIKPIVGFTLQLVFDPGIIDEGGATELNVALHLVRLMEKHSYGHIGAAISFYPGEATSLGEDICADFGLGCHNSFNLELTAPNKRDMRATDVDHVEVYFTDSDFQLIFDPRGKEFKLDDHTICLPNESREILYVVVSKRTLLLSLPVVVSGSKSRIQEYDYKLRLTGKIFHVHQSAQVNPPAESSTTWFLKDPQLVMIYDDKGQLVGLDRCYYPCFNVLIFDPGGVSRSSDRKEKLMRHDKHSYPCFGGLIFDHGGKQVIHIVIDDNCCIHPEATKARIQITSQALLVVLIGTTTDFWLPWTLGIAWSRPVDITSFVFDPCGQFFVLARDDHHIGLLCGNTRLQLKDPWGQGSFEDRSIVTGFIRLTPLLVFAHEKWIEYPPALSAQQIPKSERKVGSTAVTERWTLGEEDDMKMSLGTRTFRRGKYCNRNFGLVYVIAFIFQFGPWPCSGLQPIHVLFYVLGLLLNHP